MAITLGTGDLLFEPVEGWEKLPAGWTLIDVAGLAVDAHDNVYLVHRGEHPVIAFDRDGNFIRSWGDGIFTKRIHGISIDGDGSVFIVDDGLHAVQKFTPEGELLMTPSPGHPKQASAQVARPTIQPANSRGRISYIGQHLRVRRVWQLPSTQVRPRWQAYPLLGRARH